MFQLNKDRTLEKGLIPASSRSSQAALQLQHYANFSWCLRAAERTMVMKVQSKFKDLEIEG